MRLYFDIKNKIIDLENIFIVLCSLLPLVDSFNGMISGRWGIGSIYKIIILIVLGLNILFANININKFKFNIISLLITYIILVVLFNIMIIDDSILSFSYPIKLIFNILFFYFLYEALKNKVISKKSLNSILNNSCWVFVVSFLVPYFLGLGNTIYASGMGYKAFYISQNELSFILLSLCLYTSYTLFLQLSFVRVIQLSLIIVCGLLINTKSTIFGCLLGVLFLVYERFKKCDRKIRLITISLIFIFIILFRNLIFSSLMNIFSRFSSLRSNYYNGSLLTAILSGRNLYIQDAFEYLIDNHFLFRFFFGNGFCTSHLIEMDFIDIFFSMGLLGEIVFIIFIYQIGRVIYYNKKYDGCIIRFSYFCILLLFMFITGHVIFMAMSGTYFVIFCCYLISYNLYNSNNAVDL